MAISLPKPISYPKYVPMNISQPAKVIALPKPISYPKLTPMNVSQPAKYTIATPIRYVQTLPGNDAVSYIPIRVTAIPRVNVANIPLALSKAASVVSASAIASSLKSPGVSGVSSILAKSQYTDAESHALMRAYGMTDAQLLGISVMNAGNNPSTIFDIIKRYTGKTVNVSSSSPSSSPIIHTSVPLGAPSTATSQPSPVITPPIPRISNVPQVVVMTPTGSNVSASGNNITAYNMEEFINSIKVKQAQVGVSPASVPVYRVAGEQYQGAPGWRESNKGGEASTITSLDYAAVVGGIKVGKLVFNAIVAIIKGESTQSDQRKALDYLSQQYDDGFITEAEFNAGVADVAVQVSSASPSLANRVFGVFSKYSSTPDKPSSSTATSIFFDNAANGDPDDEKDDVADARDGGDTANLDSVTIEAQKVRAALVKIYGEETVAKQEKKDEEANKEKEKPTMHTLSWLGDTWDAGVQASKDEYDDLKDKVTEGYDVVKTYAVGPDVPIPSSPIAPASVPASTITPVDPTVPAAIPTSPSDKNKNQSAEQMRAEWDTTHPTTPIVEADVIIETSGVVVTKESKAFSNFEKQTDVRQTYLDYLNVNYPAGKNNGVNDNISRNRSELVPYIYLGVVTYKDASNYVNYLANVKSGSEGDSIYDSSLELLNSDSYSNKTSWNDSSLPQKRTKIAKIIAYGINRNIPPEVIANDVIILMQNVQDVTQRETLIADYTTGKLDTDIEIYAFANPLKSGERFVKSEEGTNAIVGVALIAMASTGIGLAAAPFAVYEGDNYKGGDMYRYKGRLENSGMYPPGVDEKHGFTYTDLTKRANQLGINSSDHDLATIDKEKASIQEGIDRERAAIEKDKILLIIAGTYFDKRDDLNEFEGTLKSTKYKEVVINPLTGVEQEVKVESRLSLGAWSKGVPIKVIGPEGYDYTLINTGEKGGPGVFLSFFPGKQVIEVSKDGKLIMSKDVNNFDETQNMVIPFSQPEIDKSLSYIDGKPLGYFTRVVLIPAGAQLTNNGFTTPVTDYIQKFYFDGRKGEQNTFTVTQKGKKPITQQIYYDGVPFGQIPITMVDEFVPGGGSKLGKGFAILTSISPDQKFLIDGVPVKNMGLMGVSSEPGQKKSVVVTVITPGFENRYVTIYIEPGKTQEVSMAPVKELYVKQEYGGGSSGGSGGDGGSGPAPKPPTTIAFGTSLVGCHIWLDAEKLSPELGTKYSTTPGYHAFKATKDGFTEFEKNVYVSENKHLEINAVFVVEAGAKYNPTTGVRVPSGGGVEPPVVTVDTFIVFGGTIVGSVVAIDGVAILITPGVKYPYPNGYHGILIKMPNKLDWLKNVYLAKGDTLTVSPIFEDIPPEDPITPITPTNTTKRVFITSNPDGAKILINGGFVGSWTPAFLDLERGMYKLTTTKTGYATINSWVWVGDIIAFGSTALSLARLAGMDV